MFDFRKVVLTFAAAALVVGSAYGQASIPNVANTTTANFVAAEGTTESLPPLTFAVTGGAAVSGSISFSIQSSVPFANQTPPHQTSPTIDASATDNNADSGTVIITGPTTALVSFASVANNLTSITVYGLRVDAAASAAPDITVTLSVTNTSGVTVTGGAYPVSYLKTSIGAVTESAAAPVNAPNVGLASTTAASVYPVTNLTINGGFPGAFKTAADVADGSQPPPAPASTVFTQGTRIAVTFSNLNANVNYYVQPSIGDGTLQLTAYTSATAATAAPTVTTPAAANGWVQLPAPVGGSSTIYYGVTHDAAANATGSAIITLEENIPSQSAVTAVSSAPVTASVVLVGQGAGGGYPQYAANLTPVTVTTPASSLLTLSTTTLLFPYVSNAGGFDTGIAITNATAGLDPTAGTYNAHATGQPGTFTVYFYGTGAPSSAYTSVTATAPGTVGTPFLLSTIAPGFDGYLVVTANFADAHGFALITNGTITEGYLAIVTNNGGVNATSPTF